MTELAQLHWPMYKTGQHDLNHTDDVIDVASYSQTLSRTSGLTCGTRPPLFDCDVIWSTK